MKYGFFFSEPFPKFYLLTVSYWYYPTAQLLLQPLPLEKPSVPVVVVFGLFFPSDFGHVLHRLYWYVLFIDRLLTADRPTAQLILPSASSGENHRQAICCCCFWSVFTFLFLTCCNVYGVGTNVSYSLSQLVVKMLYGQVSLHNGVC